MCPSLGSISDGISVENLSQDTKSIVIDSPYQSNRQTERIFRDVYFHVQEDLRKFLLTRCEKEFLEPSHLSELVMANNN